MWAKGARGWLGNSRYIEGFEDSADVRSRRCAGGFVRVRGWRLSAVGSCVLQGRRAFQTFRLSHIWALAPLPMLG